MPVKKLSDETHIQYTVRAGSTAGPLGAYLGDGFIGHRILRGPADVNVRRTWRLKGNPAAGVSIEEVINFVKINIRMSGCIRLRPRHTEIISGPLENNHIS